MLTNIINSSDIRYIAENMRDADKMEVAAASGLSPLEVLTQGVRTSSECFVYLADTPVFIVGVVEPGIIWLLGTDDILKHKRMLHRLAKKVIPMLHKKWPRLYNRVDARNTVHVRWLRSMGFQFGEPVIAGVARLPFIPFHRTVPHV